MKTTTRTNGSGIGLIVLLLTFAVLLLIGLMLASDDADAEPITVHAQGDYLSTGQTNGSGWEAGAGWHGGEIGWRQIDGAAGLRASGPVADVYWHVGPYFVTGGASYLDVKAGGARDQEFDWRAGAGLQFGWFRAGLRYEPFHHSDGLTLSVGLAVPVF